MKILAVTFDKSLCGGANRSMLMVLKYLKNKFGHDILFVSPMAGEMSDAVEKLGLKNRYANYGFLITGRDNVLSLPLRYFLLLFRTLKDIVSAYIFARKVKNEHIDIVYTNEIICFWGFFVSRFLGVPHVWHVRSTTVNVYLPPFAKWCFNAKNNTNIVISNYEVDYMHKDLKIPKNKIQLVFNGIELYDVPKSLQKRDEGFHVLLTGRIVSYKGQDEAIEAINILNHRGYNNIYLHIAGSVPSKRHMGFMNSLTQKISQCHLEKRIFFEGEVKDMKKLRSKMNVELMCSNAEPFGRVTVEAMYSGLIVIGANTGGTLDIIKDGINGLFYEKGNAVDLADKIELVYKDETLCRRLIANELDFIKYNFTVEQNVTAVNNVLEASLI